MSFFDYTSLDDAVQHGLTLFERLLPVLLLFVFVFLIYKFKDDLKVWKHEGKLRIVFATLMFIGEVAFLAWNYVHSLDGHVRFITTLPLQLCSYAIWGMALALIIKNRKLYSYIYMFGIVSVLALIFPNLNHGFNSFRYYQLYYSHSLLILSIIYMYKVHDFYPKKKDFIDSFILLQIIIAYSIILNIWLDTDFLFIGPGNKPIDFAWDWPGHLLQYEVVMILLYYVFYRLIKKLQNITD